MSSTRADRSQRFAEFEEKFAKDLDPENEVPDNAEESDSEESGDDHAGTEHYVAVGKSKLRQKDAISLGPEYRGARVSRSALEESSEEEDEDEDEDEEQEEEEDDEDSEADEEGDEEFDDPDAADLEADHIDDDDGEISSDNALCESDNEHLKDFVFRGSSKPKVPNGRIKKRPTAADFMSSSGEEADSGHDLGSDGDEDEMDDSDGDEDGARLFDLEAEEDEEEEEEGSDVEIAHDDSEESGEDEDEDEEEDEDDEDSDEGESAKWDDGDDERAQLRKMATEGHKSIVAAMTQAAKADAEKGMAVRLQRRAFDSILNLRIRLQKALVAANSFSVIDDNQDNGSEAYHAAEEAAVKLWNTIDSVRNTFLPESTRAKVGEKRKREIELDTSNQEIWESMQAVEEAALSNRRKVLDKWSERVKKSNVALSTRKLVNSEKQSLVSALDEQLLSSERLIKRARTPRSCAPAQAAKKLEEDPEIYDDADFYQLLLKELVDQRSTDTSAPGESVTTVRWAALKETKTRKHVDRRASKGRKLRYTVHEKLQNFMAPEDRRSWEEHAIDRLFGTLFGQEMELKEDEDVSDEEEQIEEAGLKLFRS
ncbi:apoptosis-antagonizing transcription factor [Chaetomium strumarium]|uniref:Protein BFR2 n=1 Tax=Chaetomium strumarium TaxID=1170767 RepID=A0AAJ0GP02_9PEZI|nr:apoptosis-antagonizing transcription factor [Chaetomium strumarium]